MTKVGLLTLEMTLTHGMGLPCTRRPHQNLSLFSTLDIVNQLLNRLVDLLKSWYFDTSLNLLSVIRFIMIASSAFFYPSILP